MVGYCKSCSKMFVSDINICPNCGNPLRIITQSWALITRDEFNKYEEARKSGVWNMITDAASVIRYTKLSKSSYYTIIKYYSELYNLYGKENTNA